MWLCQRLPREDGCCGLRLRAENGRGRPSARKEFYNFPRTTLGTGLARTGTNTEKNFSRKEFYDKTLSHDTGYGTGTTKDTDGPFRGHRHRTSRSLHDLALLSRNPPQRERAPERILQPSLARHWSRDWRALALTQVHHRSRLSDSCEGGEALSSVHPPAPATGKLIHNLLCALSFSPTLLSAPFSPPAVV